ncbi:MAG: hypothetical protein RIT04_484 [Candidatus Parcubacteria bacterium]|jgi:ABC-type glycerol-3-phosphate transport system substrate-binding protein
MKVTKFQIILIGIFVVFIIIGVIFFATTKSNQATTGLPTIEVWGTFPATIFNQLVEHLNFSRAQALTINYVQKSPEQFDKDFITTLARGGGPDAVLLPQESLLLHLDKVVLIPPTILSSRTFLDTYVPEAENYVTPAGILALPLTIDPLVMYWNRDMFTNAGIATYPKFWDEFSTQGKLLTVKDEKSNIRKSIVALGEFANVTHAREIFGSILMQAGNPVVTMNYTDPAATTLFANNTAASALANENIRGSDTAGAALTFFTKFSNPANPDYSWNRSLTLSKNAFLTGSLATYFGFASELSGIRQKNPNLNFDVAPFPQIRKGTGRATYGTMYGFSIVRSSADPTSAYTILQTLTTPEALAYLSQSTYLPPVRRDMIALGNSDPYLANFYDSALISRTWFDPNTSITTDILQEMIETFTSGKTAQYQAIKNADTKLNILIRNL